MFEELMNQLNEDLSYRPLTSSLSDADMVEIETDLGDEEHADPADETVQHLYLARDGKITFRSFTRGKGRGARGVGRYETCTVPAQTVQEIRQLLDMFLYMQSGENWSGRDADPRWVIRAARRGEGTEMTAGKPEGAFAGGMDLSYLIGQRIPIPDLFLFDGRKVQG